ncbi:MAG: type II toxin-antitoxin system RelB/DinJ family antitoxin [Desulfobulbaceae bacterium]|jgi:addiction module RelB/DinJ family antitoxin|nr:type II toxin-antitoxin system RelB/DinJ family antitoxin [Desulfobulbaceae bacterium]
MATKSHNIRIDEDIKERAAALYAHLGLNLSDAVNVFLRVSLDANGFPFPVKLRGASAFEERRSKKFTEFLDFAKENPVFEKGHTFDRDACHER